MPRSRERGGTSTWTEVEPIETTNSEGFFVVHLSVPAAGSVRLAWVNPVNGQTYYSRTAAVH